jgi:general secretion pathway protein I
LGPWAPACAGAPSLRSGGFTLIEMMVALAVFSLAAMALIRLEGATIRGATILDSTLTAQMVARNVAIEALTDTGPPAIGKATGEETNGGRTWAWTRVTTPTGDIRILRIDVAVADPGGTVQGRLTVVRPATQPITVTAS